MIATYDRQSNGLHDHYGPLSMAHTMDSIVTVLFQ